MPSWLTGQLGVVDAHGEWAELERLNEKRTQEEQGGGRVDNDAAASISVAHLGKVARPMR